MKMSFYTWYKRKQFWIDDFLRGGLMWKAYKDVRIMAENPIESCLHRQYMLSELLKFTVSNIEFYKNKNLRELSDFPIINKSTINTYKQLFITPESIIPNQKGKVHIQKTSGSTGIPFAIPQDTHCRIRRIATIKYENDKIGFHTGEPLMHLRSGKYYERSEHLDIFNKKLNIRYIDNYDVSESRLRKILDIINTHRIKTIRGYATTLDFLTRYAANQGIELPHKPFFISVGELMSEALRTRIVSNLHCHVISQYGNEENGIFGSSFIDKTGSEICLNKANCIIEILDEEYSTPVPDGTPGKVVITDLTNYAMPMIRYDTGDIACVGSRDCTGYINTLSNLQGRKTDLIYDSNDKYVDLFNNLPIYIEHNQNILQFQFIQKAKAHYQLRLCMKNNKSIDESKVIALFKDILGVNTIIDIIYYDKINLLNSGKHRIIINEYKRQ